MSVESLAMDRGEVTLRIFERPKSGRSHFHKFFKTATSNLLEFFVAGFIEQKSDSSLWNLQSMEIIVKN